VIDENWNAADVLARQRVEDGPASASAHISPYDNPLLWTGHSTVIDEMEEQLQAAADGAGAGAMSTTAAPASLILSMYIPCTYSR
jgi:threonine dehydratase